MRLMLCNQNTKRNETYHAKSFYSQQFFFSINILLFNIPHMHDLKSEVMTTKWLPQSTCGLLRLCLICDMCPVTVVGVPLLLAISPFLFFVGVFVSLPAFWFVLFIGRRFPSWARIAMSCVVIPSIFSSG